MWLVNTSTGEKNLLAKYYPSTGWFIYRNGERVDSLFDRDTRQSMWGPTDYVLEFEQTEDE